MRILVLSQHWFPENGVAQRRWAWLSKVLIEAGHEIRVITPVPTGVLDASNLHQGVAKPSEPAGVGADGGDVYVYRVPRMKPRRSITGRTFNQVFIAGGMVKRALFTAEVKKWRPDVVVGTVPALPVAVSSALVARGLGTPLVIDLRDAWPQLLDSIADWNRAVGEKSIREKVILSVAERLVRLTANSILERALATASGVIVTSDRLRRELQSNLNRPKQQCLAVVRNVFPVQSSKYQTTNVDLRNENKLRVLYAGTIGRAQNLANAVEAVSIARKKGLDLELRVVGAGAASAALRSMVRDRNLPIVFESKRPANDLADLYGWADTALVHLTDWPALEMAVPSKLYELLELRVHITGVVAGESAEIIRSLRAGHVVAPEDPAQLAQCWATLAKNRELLKIPVDGSKWVEQVRNESAPNNLLRLLDDVLNNG